MKYLFLASFLSAILSLIALGHGHQGALGNKISENIVMIRSSQIYAGSTTTYSMSKTMHEQLLEHAQSISGLIPKNCSQSKSIWESSILSEPELSHKVLKKLWSESQEFCKKMPGYSMISA